MNVVCINRNNKYRYRFTYSPFFFVGFQIQTDVLHRLFYSGQMYTKHPCTLYTYYYYTYDPLQKPVFNVKEDFQVFKSHLNKIEPASAHVCIETANQLINWWNYSTNNESRKMIRLCQWLVKIQRKISS